MLLVVMLGWICSDLVCPTAKMPCNGRAQKTSLLILCGGLAETSLGLAGG